MWGGHRGLQLLGVRGYRGTGLEGYVARGVQGCRGTWLLGFGAMGVQRYWGAEILGCGVVGVLGYWGAGLLGCQVTGIPGYQGAGLWGCRVMGVPGYGVQSYGVAQPWGRSSRLQGALCLPLRTLYPARAFLTAPPTGSGSGQRGRRPPAAAVAERWRRP